MTRDRTEAGRGGAAITRREAARRILGGVALAGIALHAPARLGGAAAEEIAAILGRSGLGALTGFAVAEAATGRIIESHAPDAPMPPASVVKIVTALYALDRLGGGHRFRTRLVAAGPVTGGRIAGDLALVGGGDPVLDTDALAAMAGRLAGEGIAGIDGRFLVDAGALPHVAATAPDQPAHAAYNPAICGLNLNFNRVRLAWEPAADGVSLDLSAPGLRGPVPVRRIRAELAGGSGPPRHRHETGAEVWRIPRSLLGGRGDMWLPVREPADYAGDVFATLAERGGIALPAGRHGRLRDGRTIAETASPPLEALMRGMLLHSTNLTAEVAGLAATPGAASHAASAAAMTRWARARFGLDRAEFVNHSGLSTESRMSPRETLAILRDAEGLAALLPERPILDPAGNVWRGPAVRAKTGTMYFLRGYAGYLEGRGRRLAFAIYAADPGARARVDPEATVPPAGARDFTARARAQENALLRRWATLYAG
jgi:D-alanyl-D-alanine carboxypeptidase/D-alanyl-D-alanine-endopeptidase (penicillin-binding protein 4)